MKTFRIIKKAYLLIGEGCSIKDKIAIFIYFSQFFIRFFYKLTTQKSSGNLLYNVTIKNRDGIFFCGASIHYVWTASSFYEESLRKYFKLNKGIFIDIGANIGKYTVMMGRNLKNKGKVIAIEPEPRNFKILKKNVELNKLDNVLLKNLACSNRGGKIDLYLERSKSHSIYGKDFHEGKISVKTSKLDSVLANLNIKKVDLIKIDVEGAEAEVLRGAKKILKSSHPKIIFEAGDEHYLRNVREVLQPFDYKIRKINKANYFAY